MHNEVNTIEPNADKLYRLVPSHFPPIDLFEQVANPDELEIVFAIESLTNDRLREEAGELALVPVEQRISGIGTSPIMAAFTHIGTPSRFTDGCQFGVYYAAKTLHTAFAETIYHREVFLRATNEPDTELTMRCYINQVALALHDIRSQQFDDLHTDDYAIAQQFAKALRARDSNGLVYRSVRDSGGECIAAFKPKAVTIPLQGGHYKYIWSSKKQKIEHILEVNLIK
ncbi:RES domain-containing protein [Shewanella vesiculosa]|uniref:RES family NAD+ phosphorylase n=1 Tax=Shewanella vesiculosa TaxID=518738 RepID=UPI000F4EF4C3|nr:RES family NAD+ phosphorylase [Shewanella vesiculosa]RPA56655.1 RES domain-containing protein [Shewanella vesiculosa]UJL43602.1 RES family NAD+ phosphorylase [Shewanella vesiculosa]